MCKSEPKDWCPHQGYKRKYCYQSEKTVREIEEFMNEMCGSDGGGGAITATTTIPTTTTTIPTTTKSACADKDDRCPSWTEYCGNTNWMKDNCAKTCGKCGGDGNDLN